MKNLKFIIAATVLILIGVNANAQTVTPELTAYSKITVTRTNASTSNGSTIIVNDTERDNTSNSINDAVTILKTKNVRKVVYTTRQDKNFFTEIKE